MRRLLRGGDRVGVEGFRLRREGKTVNSVILEYLENELSVYSKNGALDDGQVYERQRTPHRQSSINHQTT